MPLSVTALHQTGYVRQGKLKLTAVSSSSSPPLEYLPKKLNECIHFLPGIKGQTHRKSHYCSSQHVQETCQILYVSTMK